MTVDEDCGQEVCDDRESNLSARSIVVASDNCGNGTCDEHVHAAGRLPRIDVATPSASPEGWRDCPQDCGECPVGEDVIQAQDMIADDSADRKRHGWCCIRRVQLDWSHGGRYGYAGLLYRASRHDVHHCSAFEAVRMTARDIDS